MRKPSTLLIALVLSIMTIVALSSHAMAPSIPLKPLPNPQRAMMPAASYARTQQPVVSFLLRYWTLSRYIEELYAGLETDPETLVDELAETGRENDTLSPIAGVPDDTVPTEAEDTPPVDASAGEPSAVAEPPAPLPAPDEVLPGNWKASIAIDPADRARFPFPVQRLLVPYEVIRGELGDWSALIAASGQVVNVTFNDPHIFLSLEQTVTLEQVFRITIDLSGSLESETPLISGTFQLWIEGDPVPFKGRWHAEKEPASS